MDATALLCKGTYYEHAEGAPAKERPTQFTLRISYTSQYMELKASEWPALFPSKENPAVVRSIKFTHDDDTVKAMFPSDDNELKGALRSIGLSKIAGDYKGVIVLNRKTGNFTYPNTSGQCEKMESQENKF